MPTPSPIHDRRSRPPLSLKLQGKQPARPRAQTVHPPAFGRGHPPPLQSSKMAVDFYVASMLDSQVRQLMTEPDGLIHLNRCPSPYRKILVPSPGPEAREGVAYFEAELDQADEMTMSFFEATLDAFDGWVAYLWSWVPRMPWRRPKPEPAILPRNAHDIERGHTPMFVEQQPDTPGSQATATPGAHAHDQPSYFSIQ